MNYNELKSKYEVRIYRLLPFIVLILINTGWFLAAWPASLSPDSLGVIDYIRQDRYFDWHTTFWLIYVRVTTLGGVFIWLPILIQILLMNFLVFKLIRLFRPELTPTRILWLCSILAMTPWIGANQVTLWKDVTYTVFSLLGFIYVIERAKLSRYSSGGLLLLIIGSSSRHDGWVTLLGTQVVLGVFIYISRKKFTREIKLLLVSFLLATIASSLMNPSLVRMFNSEPNPPWNKSLTFLGDLAYVAAVSPNSLSDETLGVLRSYSGSNFGLSKEICETTAPFAQSSSFDLNVANLNAPRVSGMWIETFLKSPSTLLEGHFCKVRPYLPWPLMSPSTYSYYWYEWGMWEPNWLNMVPEPPIPVIRSLVTGYLEIWKINGPFLSAPGWQLTLASILIIWMLRLRKLTLSLGAVLLSYIWSRTFIILAFAPSGDARFGLAISILTLTLAVSFSKNSESRRQPNK
jgi:hypothetical protein